MINKIIKKIKKLISPNIAQRVYKRFDYINHSKESDMTYIGQKAVIDDATRFYHEHFNQEDDYDENLEIKTFEQALEFWECNGYEIR